MLKRLDTRLKEEGYSHITSNIPEVVLYYKSHSGHMRVIPVIDYHFGMHFSTSQYQNLMQQIRRMFEKKGYSHPEMLTLIFAWDVHDAGIMSQYDDSRWIIDTASRQLLIYENQPMDFYGLNSLVNGIVEESRPESRPESRKEAARDSSGPEPTMKSLIQKKAVINTLMVIANIIVFIILEIGGSTRNPEYMLQKGAMFAPYIWSNQEYYRFVTCMFMHFGVEHLANNMLILFFIGDNLERAVGKIRYLAIYFVSGIGGGVLSFMFTSAQNSLVVSAGASGAIFGVIGAMLYVLIVNKGRLEDLTARRIGFLIFFSLYYGFSSAVIDNWAHIGGLLAGGVTAFILYRRRMVS